jgi:hypothetical protein
MLEVTAMHKTVRPFALLTRCLGILWLAAVSATAARANHLGTALGADGQFYTVTAGLCGSLFPSGPSGTNPCADAKWPVLALDTTVPGSPSQRQLVQGTADTSVKSSPALIYEDGSKTLFVVWVSTDQSVSSAIKLASYDGSQWSPAIAIISNPYATKTPPQLAVTRDTHQEADPVSGNPVTHHRTVLHIVWSEDSVSGLYQAYYAPVIFEDGAWIGTVPTPAHLNTFDALDQTGQTAPGAGSGPLNTPLAYTPTVQAGSDTRSVVTGFASDTSGMLTAVEVDVLPEELRILADTCSAAILANGAQYFPGQLATLATQIQTVILNRGGAFQAEALQAISSAAQSQIVAGSTTLSTLANRTRATIVDIGARFALRGLRIVGPGLDGIAPPQVVEVLVANAPSHFLQFRATSSRPWPTTVQANGLQLFLSRTGSDALAAWTNANNSAVLYSNTQPDGTWSSVKQLQVSGSMSLTQAYQTLEQRMQY